MDIHHVTKECWQGTVEAYPEGLDEWIKLRRLGRKVIQPTRPVFNFGIPTYCWIIFASLLLELGKQHTRSTSGVLFMLGGHHIKSWIKTQSLVALSSTESEIESGKLLGRRTPADICTT